MVVAHREQLWWLLAEAAQLEHMIMCEYLYAEFSLKDGSGDGLAAGQAEAVGRWRKTLREIAVQEMLHLALVSNLMTAIGAAPVFGRPNFPQRSGYFPAGVQLDRRLPESGTGALQLHAIRPPVREVADQGDRTHRWGGDREGHGSPRRTPQQGGVNQADEQHHRNTPNDASRAAPAQSFAGAPGQARQDRHRLAQCVHRAIERITRFESVSH